MDQVHASRFDETRLLLKDIHKLKSEDMISVKKKDDNVPYGIGFYWAVTVQRQLPKVKIASVLWYGASANDDSDDSALMVATIPRGS